MTTIEQKLEMWGPGPWVDEPDREEWRAHGLPCLIVRNPGPGNLCGYVAVPPGHPMHGADYDDVPARVHGGLTYARFCADHVCHVPAPGEPDDVWWLGFDCGHAGDLVPHHARMVSFMQAWTYRDFAYVRAEVDSLAEQLARLGGETPA